MKKKFLIILLLISSTAFAEKRFNNISLGLSIANNNDDFGLGLEITTPYFFYNIFALRAHVENNWYEGTTENEPEETWTPYQVIRCGLVIAERKFNNGTIRTYGELGGLAMITNEDIDSKEYHYGIYGNFGFEFPVNYNENTPICYYLEIGANSTFPSSTADKSSGDEPIYFHGFRVSSGIRYYFN